MITSVKAEEALVTEHFLCAVEAVLVHQLSYKGAGGALVLHARLHQVNRVHSRSAGSYKHLKNKNKIKNTHNELVLGGFCYFGKIFFEHLNNSESKFKFYLWQM